MHRVNRKTICLLLGSSLLLGACALPEGEFPSLAKRPYETEAPIVEPPAEAEFLSTSLPDSLRAQLQALTDRHNAADTAFRNALPAARQAAQLGSGAAEGSEGWVVAHMEISRLEKLRSDSLSALAEIDRLIAAERDKGADEGIIRLAAPYQEAVRKDVDAQTRTIVELSNLPG